MTRASESLKFALITAVVYFVLLSGVLPLPSKLQDEVLPVLPLWAIVTLGAYLLFKLGYGVFSFNDVPEAHRELMKQIEQAKTDLRRRGVTVD
ncbi:hypothetical protein B0A48_06726 [Cryoendolithus antarcticus]|uniref:Dolichol-phosphate mannosyltransferase subunit 3 n=1 Tax=Cryoendolithus antarcticus TaxID=1507870 RepID=A0A1V8T9I4_9PEZI|nr:hypothetical protein B0A48_06726 [Cryoendolithus antarcticus]